MLSGTNLSKAKDFNYRLVFEIIRNHGPISRPDISKKSTLTYATISNIVKKLTKADLIKEGPILEKEGRGSSSVSLMVNPDGYFSVGLDFNHDHITGIIVDLNGDLRKRIYMDVEGPKPEEAIDIMVRTIQNLMQLSKVDESRLTGIGIGFPGPITITEGLTVSNYVDPDSFNNWTNVPIVDMLSKHFSVPIFLENNASAAALGEFWYGVGRSYKSFYYMFLDAGLGGGIIINDELYNGHHGNAGEIGYLPPHFKKKDYQVDEDVLPHIGQHFNLNNLFRWLREGGTEISTPDDLEDLFEENNEVLMNWLDEGIEMIGPTLTSIKYLLDPQAIIIGGRFPALIINYLRDGIEEQMKKYHMKELHFTTAIISGEAGVNASALGAATLPMYNLLAPQTHILAKTVRAD